MPLKDILDRALAERYGVAAINGSYPDPVKTPGFPNAFTAGVTRPAPRGVQKFV